MRVRKFATAIALTILLSGCVTKPVATRDTLKDICPTPLTSVQLQQFADTMAGRPELLPLGNALFRLHKEAKACRTGNL